MNLWEFVFKMDLSNVEGGCCTTSWYTRKWKSQIAEYRGENNMQINACVFKFNKSSSRQIRREATDVAKPLAPSTPPLVEAGLVGSLYVGSAPIVKSINKNVVLATTPAIVIPTPVATPVANTSSNTAAIGE
jgi:hypothetical protein